MEAPHPTPTTTSPRFQFPDSDLIIRTRDRVDFRVHKSLMSFSSRVFRDMLTLDNIAPPTSPMHVVEVSEISRHMEASLRYIYPLPSPVIQSLDQLVVLLEIADKYDISVILIAIEDFLLVDTLWKRDPVKSFGLSKKFNLKRWQAVVEPEIVKSSSRIMLTMSSSHVGDAVTAEDLRRLEFYRDHRVFRAISILRQQSLSVISRCHCQREDDDVSSSDEESDESDSDDEDDGFPCASWETFVSVCQNYLISNPTTDITRPYLRTEAIERSTCKDARRYLITLNDWAVHQTQARIQALPWIFPAEYEQKKAS